MARVVHVNAKCSVKKSYHFSPWGRLLGKMQVLKRHKGIISYLQGIHTPGGVLFDHLLCLCKRYEIHALMQIFPWLYSMMLYKLSSCCIYFIILYFFTACFIHVLVVPNQSFPCETEKLMMWQTTQHPPIGLQLSKLVHDLGRVTKIWSVLSCFIASSFLSDCVGE